MSGTTKIEIDLEIYKLLEQRRENFDQSHTDILRDLLLDVKQGAHVKQGIHVKKGVHVNPTATAPQPLTNGLSGNPYTRTQLGRFHAARERRGFEFKGKFYPTSYMKDILVKGVWLMAEHTGNPDEFLKNFQQCPAGRGRLWVSHDRNNLYTDKPNANKPKLSDKYAENLPNGWWVGTNYGRAKIEEGLKFACEHSGVEFGKDFIPFFSPPPDTSAEPSI